MRHCFFSKVKDGRLGSGALTLGILLRAGQKVHEEGPDGARPHERSQSFPYRHHVKAVRVWVQVAQPPVAQDSGGPILNGPYGVFRSQKGFLRQFLPSEEELGYQKQGDQPE